jgi:hypothetical protein
MVLLLAVEQKLPSPSTKLMVIKKPMSIFYMTWLYCNVVRKIKLSALRVVSEDLIVSL